ncbi:hypothetical protein HanXRQr2_Chr02g0079321 [Helianthus annuus]|uniref:Uncharacterized protein n=1 Tax=Helianthus annuus TaxID=4232 RepID=A0A9K3JQY0_HELAN|nr:hypothetical protein HanXRQr2_Chr02g0079321 [Helianthus annuus]KAJ0787193.1 hypothetical protein HanOQP8_Chr02g0079781 [Helianthus annuus]KAJ0952843.1 hypothetical protein HanPSC8_Chr02g0077041 [Helianthus annuus]
MQFSTDPHGRKLVSKSEKERMKKLEEILTPNRLIGSVSYDNPRTLNCIYILTLFCFREVTPHLQFGS